MRRLIAKNPETLDLFFAKMEDDSITLTPDQQKRFERLSDCYTHWLANPLLPDNRIRDYLIARYGITSRIAYQDLTIVKCIYGRVPLANKEQMRHKANHLLDAAAAAALAGNDSKAKALTNIANSIIKNNRLEEADGEEMNWEDVVPKDISLSVDPTVIGIEPVPDIKKKADKLLKQYTADIDGE